MPGPLHVLIVEDRPADAELMAAELRRHGFDPSWRRVDSEADLLASLASLLDVVLSDFKLPTLDAFKVLELVRTSGLDLPVLVVTGAVDEEVAAECVKQGACDYLLKDRLARLGPAVEQALERTRLRRDQRRAEDALLASRLELAAIFESTPVPTLVVDGEKRVVRANRRALHHSGTNRHRVLGRTIGRALRCRNIPDQDEPCGTGPRCGGCPLDPLLVAALRDREPRHDVEVELALGDEGLYQPAWFLVSVEPLDTEAGPLAVVSLQDITERRKAERALDESEEYYRGLFEENLTAVYISQPDGTLVDCNPAFARLFGFADVPEALATNVVELFPDPQARDRLLSSLQERRRLLYHQVELRRRDGQPLHVVANILGRFDDHGQVTAIQGYLFDVTETRRLEAQLLRAQRMEAVGRLAGGVAHDFNNLLQVVLGLVEVMRSQTDSVAARDRLLAELEEHATRGAQLTRQLLLFSRREPTRLETLDLNQVVEGLTQMLRRLLRESVTLAVELGLDPLPVKGDRGQLEQVLMNLVVNASDAMAEGGRLTIRTRREGESIRLEVADTGCGIPAELLPSIFDPFFTTKEQGTGLGLAVVHGVVTGAGGTVEVASRPGEGTTFVVRLPWSASGAYPALDAAPRGAATATGKGEQVLVVEDDPGVRFALGKLLSGFGYRVTTLETGQAALDLSPATAFDLVLCDQVLPDTTGVELLANLGERWPQAAMILMSGYTEDDATRGRVGEGTLRFLAKPFSAAELAREAQAALAARPNRTA